MNNAWFDLIEKMFYKFLIGIRFDFHGILNKSTKFYNVNLYWISNNSVGRFLWCYEWTDGQIRRGLQVPRIYIIKNIPKKIKGLVPYTYIKY